ncbi:hypothetical protein Avbf_08229 [Armadillidium vulgare]|nr:hypothetical protein Avbf_08229 [Armadillidium vulgare]
MPLETSPIAKFLLKSVNGILALTSHLFKRRYNKVPLVLKGLKNNFIAGLLFNEYKLFTLPAAALIIQTLSVMSVVRSR